MKHTSDSLGHLSERSPRPQVSPEQVNPHPFTPGPWRVNEGCENVFVPQAHGGFIAMMQRDISPQTLADAQLIAAAPSLYAALEQTTKGLELLTIFFNELKDHNPGWMGKLFNIDFANLNEAFTLMDRAPKEARKALAAATEGK